MNRDLKMVMEREDSNFGRGFPAEGCSLARVAVRVKGGSMGGERKEVRDALRASSLQGAWLLV